MYNTEAINVLCILIVCISSFQQGNTEQLRATLRMNVEVYTKLLHMVHPYIKKKHTNYRKPISAEVRLAVTLRYLALGDGFRSLSQQFRIGLSTARYIVRETCQALCYVLQEKYLCTPRNRDEWLAIANRFNTRWQFPHVLGCLDGKHVRISRPRRSGSLYYNYKGYFSIVLLAICNAEYEFLYVDIGAEGKASDGGTWRQSTFNQYLEDLANPLNIPTPDVVPGINRILPYYLVGDEAFRLSPNVMKPFPGASQNRKEEIYNYRLCRCRRVIENTFGIMTSRFKIFHKTIEVQPAFVQDIVMTCCMLHNYLRKESKEQYIPDSAVDQEMPDGTIVDGEWRREMLPLDPVQRDPQRNPSVYAKRVRLSLADYFLTPEGEYEAQYDCV